MHAPTVFVYLWHIFYKIIHYNGWCQNFCLISSRLVSFHLYSMPFSYPIYRSIIHLVFFKPLPLSTHKFCNPHPYSNRQIYIQKLFYFVDTCARLSGHVGCVVRCLLYIIFSLQTSILFQMIKDLSLVPKKSFEYYFQCVGNGNASSRQKVWRNEWQSEIECESKKSDVSK